MKYNIKISPEYERYREKIEDIVIEGMPKGAEIIYHGRNILYRTMLGDEPVIVKQFRIPNIINAFAYTTVRTSKALRSYENSEKMRELGFSAPKPIAYGENISGIKLVESCYICEEIKGATEMRNWEENPDCENLVRTLAREMVRLHEAGVWHKDFSPGNVLYTGNAREGYKFHYVDLNRMKFGVHDTKKLYRMFRSMNLNPDETRRLGRLYGEEAGLDPKAMEEEALRQLEGYFAERRRKEKFK